MQKDEQSTGKLIEFTSASLMFLGIIYGLILLYRNIFEVREIKSTEVQIVAVFIAAGLLGTVLKSILRKLVREYFENHEEIVSDLIRESVQIEKAIENEETAINKIDEITNSNDLNTVIVPVQDTYHEILSRKSYICPDRPFKEDLMYMAFYKNKEVIGYAKIENADYNVPTKGLKEFKFEHIHTREIPHKKKGAFIQNKMYCSFHNLINAKDTEDIRPDRKSLN